ncbi:MAG: hypothetical protein ACKOWF_04955 [Chloroflexota bacterium]
MVTDPGTAAGADRLRPLNEPRPIAVEAGRDGLPARIVERGRRHEIAAIQERWTVEDEWWREPLHREYLTVMTAAGSVRTIYTDILTGHWFAQSY